MEVTKTKSKSPEENAVFASNPAAIPVEIGIPRVEEGGKNYPAPKNDPKIDDTLKMITDSLATLTRNLLIINKDMVSKSDLSEMKKSVDNNESLILEMLYTKMPYKVGQGPSSNRESNPQILLVSAGSSHYRCLLRSAGVTEDLFVTRELHQEPPPRIPTGPKKYKH